MTAPKRGYNWINVSGGKDSTALMLWTIEEEMPDCRYVFADTQNEHPLLYEYLDYLEEVTGKKIERVETEGFLELCKRKQRFPSPQARFCTQELKLVPLARYMDDAEGGDVVHEVFVGIRAQESPARAQLGQFSRNDIKYSPKKISKQMVNRPLLDWTWQDVFAIHKRHGVRPNPLYQMGMSRVGCFPCILARRGELREMFRRFPETVEKLKAWEDEVASVAKRGEASFFPWGRFGEGVDGGIETVAAYLDRGDVFPELEEEFNGCTSVYGLCE